VLQVIFVPSICQNCIKTFVAFLHLKSVCTQIVQHVRQYWQFWHTEVVYLNGQSHKSKACLLGLILPVNVANITHHSLCRCQTFCEQTCMYRQPKPGSAMQISSTHRWATTLSSTTPACTRIPLYHCTDVGSSSGRNPGRAKAQIL